MYETIKPSIKEYGEMYYVYSYAFGYVIVGKLGPEEVMRLLDISFETHFTIEYMARGKYTLTIVKFDIQIHHIKIDGIYNSLPLCLLIKKLSNVHLSKYVNNNMYERYPRSFASAVSYKCWLQSAFAEFGWGIWDSLIDPNTSEYTMDRAIYNACLSRNKGKQIEGFKVPTANTIFDELYKLERREEINV